MSLDISWFITVMTLTSMWLAGNKSKWAWILGLLNQGFWLVFIIEKEAYGMLLLAGCLVVIYTRNLYRWNS